MGRGYSPMGRGQETENSPYIRLVAIPSQVSCSIPISLSIPTMCGSCRGPRNRQADRVGVTVNPRIGPTSLQSLLPLWNWASFSPSIFLPKVGGCFQQSSFSCPLNGSCRRMIFTGGKEQKTTQQMRRLANQADFLSATL